MRSTEENLRHALSRAESVMETCATSITATGLSRPFVEYLVTPLREAAQQARQVLIDNGGLKERGHSSDRVGPTYPLPLPPSPFLPQLHDETGGST